MAERSKMVVGQIKNQAVAVVEQAITAAAVAVKERIDITAVVVAVAGLAIQLAAQQQTPGVTA